MHRNEPAERDTTIEHEQIPAVVAGEELVSVVAFSAAGAQSVELRRGQSVVIGRDFPADLVIADASLSRQHARFVWHDDGLIEVEDLGSRNGTLVALEKVERKLLQPGERVSLGAVTCAVYRMRLRDAPSYELGSYDELLAALRAEVARARELGRTCALLALRAYGDAAARHVTTWALELAKSLRSIDRVAVYDAQSVLVLLPEQGLEAATRTARALIEKSRDDARLRAGVASFPESASSHEKLVSIAQANLRAASASAPVQARDVASAPEPAAPDGVIVRSRSMVELYELVRRVAERSVAVLVLGETGTGKEVIASAIHSSGPRAKGPLRAVNCAAIAPTLTESVLFGHERGAFTGAHQSAKGIFEEADGGTLFLDEIGDLNPSAQAALLRVLETRKICRVGSHREIPVDVRIVAATHRDLEAMAERGEFRADLLYRLNAISLHVPPLRERSEEIAALAQHFLHAIARAWQSPVVSIAPDALERLTAYAWPGNVRELRNVIERALVVCKGDRIGARDLTDRVRGTLASAAPPSMPPPPPPQVDADAAAPEGSDEGGALREKLKDYETKLILDALRSTSGSQVRAAGLLGLPVRTLVHKIKTLGIRHAYARE